jgi:hypothetical protein
MRMTSRLIVVRAFWDDEAGVWTAASDDIGLATEAETVEELRSRARAHVSDLLEAEGKRETVELEFVIHAHDRVAAALPA